MWAFMHPFSVVPAAPRRCFATTAQALSEEVVAAIRASTDSARSCAARHHVAHTTVVRIRNGLMRATPTNRPPWIRVSDDTVEEMRVRHEEAGWTLTQLSRFYGVPKPTVWKILEYRRR